MLKRFALPLISFCTLTSCSLFYTRPEPSPYCAQLNSKLVFNAATNDTRRADIDRAERPLMQHNYDQHCTDAR